MATELEIGRPNIRIEIKNNSEPMEIDENNRSEEEGEIRESLCTMKNSDLNYTNNFIVGKDIFQRDLDVLNSLDQKKLQERAKRFALKPEEISTFTEHNLQHLYNSLGITTTNIDQVRFEAIHVRISKELSVRDVISYFMNYAPSTIEKIDDESYNIVWEDKLSTARTLFNISQLVRGMPVRVASEHIIDNYILDESDSVTDGKVLNENRQVELRENFDECDKLAEEDSVDISIINIPIPPGYWRLGKKSINSCSVLMRFSLKIDKKPYQIENCNKYYRNIPINRSNESTYKGIFSRNKDIIKEVHDKDPWGILAKNWDEDLVFREREHYSYLESDENTTNQVSVNPEMRVRLTAKRRLGQKQIHDDLAVNTTSEKEQSDESEHEAERKSIKMPRMRMYADEEEEKIKRKKLLLTLKKQTEKLKKTEIPNSDLRNILQITNKNPKVNTLHDEVDLSVNLKNRGRKLVFTVSQDGSKSRPQKFSMKDRLDKPRAASPEDRKPISPIRFRNDSPEYEKWPTRVHQRERKRVRSPVEKRELKRSSERRFSGRMYSSKQNENYLIQKPKSKVALVIKTQKKPSVASTIQSRNRKFDSSSSSEESSSEDSSSASSEEGSDDSTSTSDSESDSSIHRKHSHTKLSKVPLKVEIKNDQYKKK
ncbi:hypothetical protein WA026_008634 [Henosepilachna vigintioctopunctata]|uniref:Nuclear cap-binding protein subunit 3 n=1 Tax=Henosepilachna vigintioctopunctata TaxID=420089 RepID=A0AAW1UHD0_9CUCU